MLYREWDGNGIEQKRKYVVAEKLTHVSVSIIMSCVTHVTFINVQLQAKKSFFVIFFEVLKGIRDDD